MMYQDAPEFRVCLKLINGVETEAKLYEVKIMLYVQYSSMRPNIHILSCIYINARTLVWLTKSTVTPASPPQA